MDLRVCIVAVSSNQSSEFAGAEFLQLAFPVPAFGEDTRSPGRVGFPGSSGCVCGGLSASRR
jgi:hypothetical protein